MRSSDRSRQSRKEPFACEWHPDGAHESRTTARGHGPRWPAPDDCNVPQGKEAPGLPGDSGLDRDAVARTVDAAPAADKGKASKGGAPVGMPTQPSEQPVAETAWTPLLRKRCSNQNSEVQTRPPRGPGEGQAVDLRVSAGQPRERATKRLLKLQPGEPHDRHQGAINLEGARWCKPSKPGRTARAERVQKLASLDRR